MQGRAVGRAGAGGGAGIKGSWSQMVAEARIQRLKWNSKELRLYSEGPGQPWRAP